MASEAKDAKDLMAELAALHAEQVETKSYEMAIDIARRHAKWIDESKEPAKDAMLCRTLMRGCRMAFARWVAREMARTPSRLPYSLAAVLATTKVDRISHRRAELIIAAVLASYDVDAAAQ